MIGLVNKVSQFSTSHFSASLVLRPLLHEKRSGEPSWTIPQNEERPMSEIAERLATPPIVPAV